MPSDNISSKKKLNIFAILENYCILYKKLFKKYQFITDQNLLLEITNTYTIEVLTNLLEKLEASINNFLVTKKENPFKLLKNFWVILKNLKAFYKTQHQDKLLKEINLEIRQFKQNFLIKEAKSMITKNMKTFLNNSVRVFFKSSRILQLFTSKEKVDFEDRELKKSFKEMIITPLESELEIFENIVTEEVFGLMAIIKKEIFSKVFEFLFQGIFAYYKMNEFGSSFTENVWMKIMGICNQKIREKNSQTFNFYMRKLKETFMIFKLDKNEIEKLIKTKEEKVINFIN